MPTSSCPWELTAAAGSSCRASQISPASRSKPIVAAVVQSQDRLAPCQAEEDWVLIEWFNSEENGTEVFKVNVNNGQPRPVFKFSERLRRLRV